MSNTNQSQEKRAYNHHISGYGFLNRARVVPVKRGEDFLAVDVTALEGVFDGNWDDIEKTRYDCKVVGNVAKTIIADHMDAINDRDITVMAAFKLGGCKPDIYLHENTGEHRVSLKSRLLKISWMKVGDNVVDIEAYYARDDERQEDTDVNDEVIQSQTDSAQYPAKIVLDPEAEDFQRRKLELKEAGYRFNAGLQAWFSPDAQQGLAA